MNATEYEELEREARGVVERYEREEKGRRVVHRFKNGEQLVSVESTAYYERCVLEVERALRAIERATGKPTRPGAQRSPLAKARNRLRMSMLGHYGFEGYRGARARLTII